jgi:inhibitor of growth protein 3
MPTNTSQYQLNNGNATTSSFRAVNTTPGSKRSRPNHTNANTNGASASTSTFHVDPMYNRIGNTNASNGSRRDALAAPPSSSSSHPSLMYGPAAMSMSAYDRASGPAGTASAGVADWPAPTQLEGPGMPVARKLLYPPPPLPPPPPPPQWQVAEEVVDPAIGDVEGEIEGDEELDNKRYCICDRVSYGEMIACDDSSCEKEWVRRNSSSSDMLFFF